MGPLQLLFEAGPVRITSERVSMFDRRNVVCLSCLAVVLLGAACGKDRDPHEMEENPSMGDGSVSCTVDGGSADGACPPSAVLSIDFCDRITAEITPTQVGVGGEIVAKVVAPNAEQNGLTAVWTAEPDGTFADSQAAVTTYRCESPGRKTLTFVAMDARGCDATRTVEMSCIAVAAP